MAPLLVARDNICVGWHCLTGAQRFGVIFSVVTTAIVLFVAWLFYLGRKASDHESGLFVYLPGGRRTRRDRSQTSDLAFTELPVVHQWPGQPPRIIQQPVIYQLGRNQPSRAYPYVPNRPCFQPPLLPLAPAWGVPLIEAAAQTQGLPPHLPCASG